jgi:NAD(P) transhydrogenase subunit beta
MQQNLFHFVYLVAAILFIFGLKGLASPKTALRGNFSAMLGMGIAILATILHPEIHNYTWIIAGLVVGGIIGTALALKVQMTSMPELVAILHSFVGLAAVAVAYGTLLAHPEDDSSIALIEIAVGSVIGAVTFTGSVIAFGKLKGSFGANPLQFTGQHILNLILGLITIGFCVHFALTHETSSFLIATFIAFALGILLVTPIGGADMPVVVSMLNSYSGWAASATGFTLNNPLLIATGALVGSSGAILSFIMCRAMNRSFFSVILGGFGNEAQAADASAGAAKTARSSAVEDVAFMLENSSKVIFIPGYGMAVAQAQHAVKELASLLQEKGIEVKFAIHPVAGRMPGHMNVLLAEADISYDDVFEMDEINGDFAQCDVAFVIGANDIVNPDAKTNKTSPLYGMPILDAYKAKQIFVSKRSMKPGYAGVDNSLFYYDNCSLVFGDAKATIEKITGAIRGTGH